MGLLRSIKSEYEIYFHAKLDAMIALDGESQAQYKKYWKSNKGKKGKSLPSQNIIGYKMIPNEALKTLKIDFSQDFQFEIRDLEKAKFKDA